jgi:signal transduction histidine kinase
MPPADTVIEVKSTRFVAGVLFAFIGTGFLLESLGIWTVDIVYIWPLCLIAIGISVLIGRAKRVRIEEGRSAQLAVAEERVRIARELHDIVAHGVSLMTIQITAARRVLTRQPEQADRALLAAEQAGRQAMTELRSILAVLRGADANLEAAAFRPAAEGVHGNGGATAPLPQLGDIPGLVDQLRVAGLDVDLDVFGVAPPAPPGTQLAVYRVVQEALTNTVRHASKASVKVTLTYAVDKIHVNVEDDGAGMTRATPEGAQGHGLVGMQERVVAAGGTLRVGPNPFGPGWEVDATIPLVGAAT